MFTIPHANRRTVCPPAKLNHQKAGTPSIIVGTLPRSGTHVLLDLLLNNFDAYKRTPLYVDLDRCCTDQAVLQHIKDHGGYLLKTHYPANPETVDTMPLTLFHELLSDCPVIRTCRPRSAVERSIADMWPGMDVQKITSLICDFEMYWEGKKALQVDFADLLDRKKQSVLVEQIGDWLGLKPNAEFHPPPLKSDKLRIYRDKLLTRLLGKYAPTINTTIRTR